LVRDFIPVKTEESETSKALQSKLADCKVNFGDTIDSGFLANDSPDEVRVHIWTGSKSVLKHLTVQVITDDIIFDEMKGEFMFKVQAIDNGITNRLYWLDMNALTQSEALYYRLIDVVDKEVLCPDTKAILNAIAIGAGRRSKPKGPTNAVSEANPESKQLKDKRASKRVVKSKAKLSKLLKASI
jgi:hypothetical protein